VAKTTVKPFSNALNDEDVTCLVICSVPCHRRCTSSSVQGVPYAEGSAEDLNDEAGNTSNDFGVPCPGVPWPHPLTVSTGPVSRQELGPDSHRRRFRGAEDIGHRTRQHHPVPQPDEGNAIIVWVGPWEVDAVRHHRGLHDHGDELFGLVVL
jgi:hypothetical protein